MLWQCWLPVSMLCILMGYLFTHHLVILLSSFSYGYQLWLVLCLFTSHQTFSVLLRRRCRVEVLFGSTLACQPNIWYIAGLFNCFHTFIILYLIECHWLLLAPMWRWCTRNSLAARYAATLVHALAVSALPPLCSVNIDAKFDVVRKFDCILQSYMSKLVFFVLFGKNFALHWDAEKKATIFTCDEQAACWTANTYI